MSRSTPPRALLPGLAIVMALATLGGCRRGVDPDTALARRFRDAMERWDAGIESASRDFDARLASVPKRERRAFLLRETTAEAALHDRALADIDGLGALPKALAPMVSAAREAIGFLSRNAHARIDAAQRRDLVSLDRLETECEREVPLLLDRLTRERGALERLAGPRER